MTKEQLGISSYKLFCDFNKVLSYVLSYHFCIVNCQAWGHIPYSGQIQKTTGSKETLSQSQVPKSGRLCQQTIGCRNHFLDKSNISRKFSFL